MEQTKQNKWKDKYFLIFAAILLAAVGIRLYYFLMTANQPIWWDEAQYLATAKTYAGHAFEDLAGQRLPGFPLLASLFFRAGLSEPVIKFFLCFVPSIIMIFLVYVLIRKMYPDKRVALISMALVAVLWENLFWSNRFMTDNFGLLFELLAILLIYGAYEHRKSTTSAYMTGILFPLLLAILSLAIAVLFRPGQLLIMPAIGLFIIILFWEEDKFLSWITIIFGAIVIALFYFIPSLQYLITSNMNTNDVGPSWNSLNVFSGLLLSPFLYIPFFIGFVVGSFGMLGLLKDEDKDKKSNLFCFMLIISVLSIYIFIIRAPNFEYRWFFGMLPAILCFTAKGIIDIAEWFGSLMKNSNAVPIIMMIILGIGLVGHLTYADAIISAKTESYLGVKAAGLWIKNHSNQGDIIFSISKPQTAYYSERKVMSFSLLNTTQQMNDYIDEHRPRYIELSAYEPHPEWINEWIYKNPSALVPVFGAPLENSNQFGIIVYEFDYAHLNFTCEDSCSASIYSIEGGNN